MQTVLDEHLEDLDDSSSASPTDCDHTSAMTLEIGDWRFPVTHLCGDWLILLDAVDLPAGDGVLHLLMGKQYTRQAVRLSDGIEAGRRRQPLLLDRVLASRKVRDGA